ncbi:MAG: hypothetical protein PHF21_01015 [Bacilli bacterium]|nr:hypothetical protein [Bacilli bacterium]
MKLVLMLIDIMALYGKAYNLEVGLEIILTCHILLLRGFIVVAVIAVEQQADYFILVTITEKQLSAVRFDQ